MSEGPENGGGALHKAALKYAGLGWRVLPLRGKIPVPTDWVNLATTDEEQIDAWWEESPNYNIGIACGWRSGIIVVDIDPDKGGEETLAKLLDEHGDLPLSVEQITGGNGRHLIYRYRPGLRNGSNVNGLAGIDLRVDGGQIVSGPSVHPVTGNLYFWKAECAPWEMEPVDIPQWLYDALFIDDKPVRQATGAPVVVMSDISDVRLMKYVEEALQGELETLRNTGEGGRNTQLNVSAMKMAQLAHTGVFSESEMQDYLLDAALHAGLKEGESVKTIRSGWNKGLTEPRDLNELKEDVYDGLTIAPSFYEAGTPPLGEEEFEGQELYEEQLFYEEQLNVPRGALNPPGMLGEMCKWIDKCAFRPAPLLTLGCALSLLGTLFGRKYRSPTDTRTNLYILSVASTGAGKDNARKRVKNLVAETGIDLIGPDDIGSDAGLVSLLEANPRQLLLVDEIGHMLNSMNSKGAGTWLTGIKTFLTKIYGCADNTYNGRALRGQTPTVIQQPHLCVYGTATHVQFYGALDNAGVSDGFLNRLMVFELPEGREAAREPKLSDMTPPPHLVQWMQDVDAYIPPGGSPTAINAGSLGAPTSWETVDMVPTAKKMFSDFEDEIDQFKGATRELWVRAPQHAVRLAMIRAIGCSFISPKIQVVDAEWALELARWSVQRFASSVDERVAENRVEGDTKRVLRKIRDAGKAGLTQRQLTRSTRWLNPRQRTEILNTLDQAGEIQAQKIPPASSKGGRPSYLFTALATSDSK